MNYFMQQTMRWFGPNDLVPLSYIRQAGCSGVVTALHQIPVGDIWHVQDIEERIQMIEQEGLTWKVVESLPVSEDIKKQKGNYLQHIENYKQSIVNLAACGIEVITYNFMPVLDWLRTDVNYSLPNGSKALYFNRTAFIAFDVFLLKRPGAENEYTDTELAKAAAFLEKLNDGEKQALMSNCMLGLPGSKDAFTADLILKALNEYAEIDADKLREHLRYFLQEVIPVAEKAGIKMAIHPDDPPYPLLGLPRIVSTEKDLANIIDCAPYSSNGLCFCLGSLGARQDNDLLQMMDRFQDHIHFLHLRNTKKDSDGNFYEAEHLGGDTDMFAMIQKIRQIQQRRKISIPMRPDHGHQMLDDLQKNAYPGYSAIGRLKGLAELRGLEYAISNMGSDAG